MCPRIPKVHTMRGLVKAQGLLLKSSCHFSLKNHFLLCMECSFCHSPHPRFLPRQENQLEKYHVKKERSGGSKTGAGQSSVVPNGLNWCKGSCTFSPLASCTDRHAHRHSTRAHIPEHVHMYIMHARIPGHAHTCIHRTSV